MFVREYVAKCHYKTAGGTTFGGLRRFFIYHSFGFDLCAFAAFSLPIHKESPLYFSEGTVPC